MLKAIRITVNGRVQGVGFRPFIFSLADQYKVKGTVQNNMDGVRIFAESDECVLEKFVNSIKEEPPRLARIDDVMVIETQVCNYDDFSIIPSDRIGKSSLVVPVDAAICEDCLAELTERDNFRYRYPFINCTQCGPRYTIIDKLPYDRPYTSMSSFQMCDKCKEEYNDPLNRRHHAQPIACPDCGPAIQLFDITGSKLATDDTAIEKVKMLLKAGAIVAIKGIGGYHLACNALNDGVIHKLRVRKKRPKRPLAVMAKSIEAARHYCHISTIEEKMLKSAEAPIVVMNQKANPNLPKSLNPELNTVGIMLPYTPLHFLLFDDCLELLVMTSANPSGMPILYQDEQAYKYLAGIADYVLTNNRPILHPLDDSVVQIVNEQQYFLRRSRGFAPDPIATFADVDGIIALGGQQKNTFALGRYKQIFIGPHIGDLDNIDSIDFFKNELNHFQKWVNTDLKLIAVDLHPGYSTHSLANELNAEVVYVQHHHAHHVSCMEDNRLVEDCFGIILDGTGYGTDGNIWGFELIYGGAYSFKRLAHLKYTPLPGGEKAIKEPWRNAVGMLIAVMGFEGVGTSEQLFPGKELEIGIIYRMVINQFNSPLAGTCGRLFDAVSAMLNLSLVSSYDGEAAILLSELMPVESNLNEIYPYNLNESIDSLIEIDFSEMICQVAADSLQKKSKGYITEKFHHTLVAALIETICLISAKYPELNKKVVLSGGSFHNRFLLTELTKHLTDNGFGVFSHHRVPCNDGGLALGQIIIAANK